MAVTNAQIAEQLEALKNLVEQKFSFEVTNPSDAEAVLGMLEKLGGDNTEVVRRLAALENSMNDLHSRVYHLSQTSPAAKSFKQRWLEFWAPVMGSAR